MIIRRVAFRPIGPAWSGRCPVTAKIAGSNPVWVAWEAFLILDFGFLILDFEIRNQKSEIGNWKLEIGNWKLEIGNWKLEIGKQLLRDGLTVKTRHFECRYAGSSPALASAER